MGACFQTVSGVKVATLSCIPCFIKAVINFGLALGAVVAVAFIIISGIRYITSNGDQIRIAQARQTITYAIIGLVIVVLAYAIVNFVGKMVGIKFFDLCP